MLIVKQYDTHKIQDCCEFGELLTLSSKNYNKGSGNEHLIGTLERAVNREYSKLLINSMFGEGTV